MTLYKEYTLTHTHTHRDTANYLVYNDVDDDDDECFGMALHTAKPFMYKYSLDE